MARKSAVASIKSGADKHAANILPVIRKAQKAGASTLRQIAERSNGARWSVARHVSQEHAGPRTARRRL